MPKLELQDGEVTVRMYRQGHGDCFLLALPRQGGGDPVYVLIDCGYKPGSPAFLKKKTIQDVVDQIGEATGFHLDLVIVTHEHQDHVNGFWKQSDPYFKDFRIDEAWFAWTENPNDGVANDLRAQHKDVLVGLVEARNKLALAAGEDDSAVQRLDSLLALELGGEDELIPMAAVLAAVKDPANSGNKQSMKLVKDEARKHRGVQYLLPGEIWDIPGSKGIRAFVLGPPRNPGLLRQEDPVGKEGFPQQAAGMQGLSFSAAAVAKKSGPGESAAPFSPRHCVSKAEALADPDPKSFFVAHYGQGKQGENDKGGVEVRNNAAWRRIDNEWLYSAESLALSLNDGINNTSLVLAFELPARKKVLLFVGDAQRGNWISWKDLEWKDGDRTITARDLLERTVLYKVGHHGSHNATLAGGVDDKYANLSWMGQGAFASEFTAMITAVHQWAIQVKPKPWNHPLPSIRSALLKKTQGRVFQMDIDRPEKPDEIPQETWDEFTSRAAFTDLYFDYIVRDA
ncbi:MAG TPA: hypothetical protein VH394_12865 [Thermoanaerobaculia bacterium]|jgi:beta-lactamase superfamily II metal-dependent hydrolase|nr:hypothetical protein [Thermoanaerobaculia bacterium]